LIILIVLLPGCLEEGEDTTEMFDDYKLEIMGNNHGVSHL